jgi:hypothetical protein
MARTFLIVTWQAGGGVQQSHHLRAGAARLCDAIAHYADGEHGPAALEQLTA